MTTSRPDPRAKPQIDDRGDEPLFLQRVEAFVRRFGGHDSEAVHLEKLHERPAHGHIVFDHEHETRGILGHGRPV